MSQIDWNRHHSGVDSALLDADESVFESPEIRSANMRVSDWQEPVYETCETALLRKRLVLTPYMLLDRMRTCLDLVKEAQDNGKDSSMTRENLTRIGDEVEHVLHLLWRSGLWTNTPITMKVDSAGNTYRVVAEPFTDGKYDGKPLPTGTPEWIQENLGVLETSPERS